MDSVSRDAQHTKNSIHMCLHLLHNIIIWRRRHSHNPISKTVVENVQPLDLVRHSKIYICLFDITDRFYLNDFRMKNRDPKWNVNFYTSHHTGTHRLRHTIRPRAVHLIRILGLPVYSIHTKSYTCIMHNTPSPNRSSKVLQSAHPQFAFYQLSYTHFPATGSFSGINSRLCCYKSLCWNKYILIVMHQPNKCAHRKTSSAGPGTRVHYS